MDIGKPLNPAIDIGQIEGAFIQGVGLMTLEEELFTPSGEQLTKGTSNYKIPSFGDIPEKFKVELFDATSNRHGLFHSKVGHSYCSKLFTTEIEGLRRAATSDGFQCSVCSSRRSPTSQQR